MSGISSIGSSSATSASYINPLDLNGDGVVDSTELQKAAQSGLLSASILSDEDSSDPSATDQFADSLAGMLLQMQENSSSQTGAMSSDSSSSQSPMDQLFASMDTNGDGKVSSAEFVAGRPKDMSADTATALFNSIDTQGSGSLDKDQIAEGLNVLKSSDSSASDYLSLETSSTSDSSTTTASTASTASATSTGSSDTTGSDSSSTSSDQGTTQGDLLSELEISAAAYQNTYGQYDLDPSSILSVQ